jgi:hypothetical protein
MMVQEFALYFMCDSMMVYAGIISLDNYEEPLEPEEA